MPSRPIDFANLRTGALVALADPQVAFRSCVVCQDIQFDENTGQPALDAFGQVQPRFTLPLCKIGSQSKCPRGCPAKDRGFNADNRQIWMLYLRWREDGVYKPDRWQAKWLDEAAFQQCVEVLNRVIADYNRAMRANAG